MSPQGAYTTVEDLSSAVLDQHPPKRKALQSVLTKRDKFKISRWMQDQEMQDGKKQIRSNIVRQLPALVRSSTAANLKKAERIFKARNEIINYHSLHSSRNNYITVSVVIRHVLNVKLVKS